MIVAVKICTHLPVPVTDLPALTDIANRAAEAFDVPESAITMGQEGNDLVLTFEVQHPATPRAAEPATGPVTDSGDAGQRLHDLYGTGGRRARQIRIGNNSPIGWWAHVNEEVFYVLRGGTHAGPFGSVNAAERDAKRQATQMSDKEQT